MKRSYIKRHKPLSSKSRIGRRNGKRRTPALRYYDRIKADRNSWKDETKPICFSCRRTERQCGGLDIDEIETRAQAPRSWGQRCNYIKHCRECHTKRHDQSWPHDELLALKKLHDGLHYSLPKWLAIKPRPETYLTEAEIERCMETLR